MFEVVNSNLKTFPPFKVVVGTVGSEKRSRVYSCLWELSTNMPSHLQKSTPPISWSTNSSPPAVEFLPSRCVPPRMLIWHSHPRPRRTAPFSRSSWEDGRTPSRWSARTARSPRSLRCPLRASWMPESSVASGCAGTTMSSPLAAKETPPPSFPTMLVACSRSTSSASARDGVPAAPGWLMVSLPLVPRLFYQTASKSVYPHWLVYPS